MTSLAEETSNERDREVANPAPLLEQDDPPTSGSDVSVGVPVVHGDNDKDNEGSVLEGPVSLGCPQVSDLPDVSLLKSDDMTLQSCRKLARVAQ